MLRVTSTSVIASFIGLALISPTAFVNANDVSVQGSLSTRYTFRTTRSQSDNDLQTFLNLDYGQPYSDDISASIQAGAIFDLDPTRETSPFRSASDSFGDHAVGRLYHAYLDLNDEGFIHKMRLGRQYIHEFESLHFDGVKFESDPSYILSLDIYGGVPVHLYENEIGDGFGDWLAGGAVKFEPADILKFRLDYAHLKDNAAGFRSTIGDIQDNLFVLSAWWDVSKYLDLYSRLTSFSDQLRDASLSVKFKWPEKEFQFRYDTYVLLKSYSFRVTDLDGYGFAGAYEPFWEMTIAASKGISKYFAADGGFSIRRLADYQAASAFNHGFAKCYLTFASTDFPVKGLSASLTGDYYTGMDNSLKNNSYGTSFSIAQILFERKLELFAGSAFYLYRYELFVGNEADNVQTYFAGLEAKILSGLKAKIRYEFENNSLGNFHTIDMGATWSF